MGTRWTKRVIGKHRNAHRTGSHGRLTEAEPLPLISARTTSRSRSRNDKKKGAPNLSQTAQQLKMDGTFHEGSGIPNARRCRTEPAKEPKRLPRAPPDFTVFLPSYYHLVWNIPGMHSEMLPSSVKAATGDTRITVARSPSQRLDFLVFIMTTVIADVVRFAWSAAKSYAPGRGKSGRTL